MHELSTYEVLKECERIDEHGRGTCAVNAMTERHDISMLIDENDDTDTVPPEPVIESTHNTTKAIIKLHSRDEFTQIDLIFPSADDFDLHAIWNVLNDFDTLSSEEDADENASEMAVFTLTLAPTAYKGKYFVTAVAPVLWVLQPVAPGSDQEARMLTFLYQEENVGVFQNDNAEAEYQQIEAEIDEELRKQAEHEAYINERKKRQEEYERKQSERIQAARRAEHPVDTVTADDDE